MTEQEAIEALGLNGGLEISGNTEKVAKFFEGLDVAIQALEKQIPKKPRKINIPNTSWSKAHTRYECPSCGKYLNYIESTCCELCGQHIDRGE